MTPKLTERLTKLLPMLASDKPGEVTAAVGRIISALASEKLDLHDLAKGLCSGRPASASDASGFADWAADFKRREAEREAYERAAEAEHVKRAEAYAAEKAAKAAARAAEHQTPEYRARAEQRRQAARAKRTAERAEAATAEAAAEAERRESERIAAEGPRWGEIGDAARRSWIAKILRDPQAKLDPSATEALSGIEDALAPSWPRRRGRRQKPKITWKMIAPEWIAEFEKAARDHTMRQRTREMRP